MAGTTNNSSSSGSNSSNNSINRSKDVERPNESLWHKVKAYINKVPNRDPPPYVTCPVCMDVEIQIVRVPPMDPKANRCDGDVLACGHMICRECWTHIVVVDIERDGEFAISRCPICRLVLEYGLCGCAVESDSIPFICDGCADLGLRMGDCNCDADLTTNAVPLTVPEGRDITQEACSRHVAEARVTIRTRREVIDGIEFETVFILYPEDRERLDDRPGQ
ncbi:hypothetical protein B0T19DRAFT_404271 [Cercophora scortea]|uniref:RING-type domain-containing protein n=1 Tax=Cercophora scortea TaxID=314031 RepID=A0AAE0I709_9PEZI|nr:hypothetical protein B0T19DRAFT_404271 [Cercophora scortea]